MADKKSVIPWPRVIEISVLVGLGLFLYVDTLKLPLFSDDVVHRWLAESTSLWGLWKGFYSLWYYRPLSFVAWRATLWLAGASNPVLLHGISVTLHILNGLLVAVIARRLAKGPLCELAGLIAGALFISFPFSYQAVSWVGAMCHPVLTSFILGALLSAMSARRWPGHVLALLLNTAACFAHEAGVVFVGWLLGYELLYGAESQPGSTLTRRLVWPLIHLALSIAYLVLYFSLPRAESPLPPLTAERLTQNGSYLMQGLAFPIAPLTRLTMAAWGWNDLQAAQVAALLSVSLLLPLCWLGKELRLLAFSLLCFVCAIIPSWLTLYYGYVISGPRLLYLASVGATLAWAGGLRALAGAHASMLRRFLTLLLTGLIVLFGSNFVRVRQHINDMGGDLIWQVVKAAAGAPADEQMLIVNYPAWLAPDRSVYPIGHEGTEFMPGYANVSDLSWVNNGPRRDIQTAKFANTLIPLPGLTYGVRGPEVGWEELAEKMRAAGSIYAVHYTAHKLRLIQVGRLASSPVASPDSPLAIFDGRVTLAAAEATRVGEEIVLRMTWHSHGPLTDTVYSVFVHLYDASGRLVAQADGFALGGMYPFWMWRAGEQIEEIRYLSPENGQFPPVYRVAVGIYDLKSGQRLPALAADGSRFGDDAVPVGG